MADATQEFLESIYRLANRVKRGVVTDEEKKKIINAFRNAQGNAEERAIKSIETVIGPIPWEQRKLLEKSAEASANLERLLADMAQKAQEWAARNK